MFPVNSARKISLKGLEPAISNISNINRPACYHSASKAHLGDIEPHSCFSDAEFTEFSESSSPFRKNSIVIVAAITTSLLYYGDTSWLFTTFTGGSKGVRGTRETPSLGPISLTVLHFGKTLADNRLVPPLGNPGSATDV